MRVDLEKIINYNNIGYSLCEVIYDRKSNPIDFVFMETNEIFQDILGINLSNDESCMKSSGKNYVEASTTLHNPSHFILECFNLIKEGENGNFSIFETESKSAYEVDFIYESKYKFTLIIKKANIMDKLLVKKSEYFESIINNLNDLIIVVAPDYTITYTSPSSKKLLGYEDVELMGRRIFDVVSEENNKLIKEITNIINESNNETNWLFEVNQKRKDGKKVVIEYLVNTLKNSKGETTGFMALGRDITEWVSAKRELKENKINLTTILNSTVEGIFGLDEKGYITFVNNACLGLLGYNDNYDLVNKHVQKIMGADITEEIFIERFQINLMASGGSYEVEQFIRSDGSNFIVEFYIHPQIIDGRVVGSVVTFFDITEKLKTENALYEAERSKSVLIANLPGLVYRCDFDEDYTFRFVSDGCYDLIGYFPESLINNRDTSYREIIMPKYRDHIWKRWNSLINKNEMFKEEYEIRCADGSTKWVLEQGQIIYDINNKIEALEGIIIDIDDQKKKQKEIEYLLTFDSLTGIRNRFSFDKASKDYFNEEYLPMSLIIGDINGLRLINEAFDHSTGDQVIIKTAELLTEVVGDRNLVARTSGDEFAIFLPNTCEDEAYLKLKEIMAHIDNYNDTVKEEYMKVNIALGFSTLENLNQDFNEVVKIAEEYMHKRKLNDANSSQSSVMSYIKSTMYERSQITEEHAERTKEHAQMIGEALNLTQVQLDELALLSTLHDIGKVGIDDSILNKPGPLTEEEWVVMKSHCEIGYRICMTSPELMSIAPYILSHHENWDGSGYPSGLKGEEIPLLSRIISVVDAYDAMTQDRPYRKATTKEAALKEIEDNAGKQFDPEIAALFIKLTKNKN